MSLLVISRVIIIIFEPPPASLGRVTLLVAYLTDDVDPRCSTAASSSTTTPPSWRSTATATAWSRRDRRADPGADRHDVPRGHHADEKRSGPGAGDLRG
jgi:hypothetical protein